MDVTKENFIALLPTITENIKECDFVAIDTELSGLMRKRSVNRYDLPEDRFAKAVDSSKGYFIMQFGLSCFKQIEPLKYSNQTYNFYIFPQSNGGYGDVDRTFSIQAHAIQFLTTHDFDFNKLFKHGISYLTFQEKKSMTNKLKSENKARLKAEKEDQRKKGSDNTEQKNTAPIDEEEQKKLITLAKGFLEVLELMILYQKPIIGHNLSLDLIQIINQFIETLTTDYTSFKETCHSIFPLVYDTKFIAHAILDPATLTNNQSRLNDLYCQLRDCDDLPRIVIDNLKELFDAKQLPHQAGYDAFMSGYCFIVLCESYIREKNKHKSKKEKTQDDCKLVSLTKNQLLLSEFSNKIHFSYSYDFKYYNLGGEEEDPDRNHVFYLEFPHTWILDDIFAVFRKFNARVDVNRLNRTSALCALKESKYADKVSNKINSNNTGPDYKIFTYEFYVENIKHLLPERKIEANHDGGDVEMSEL